MGSTRIHLVLTQFTKAATMNSRSISKGRRKAPQQGGEMGCVQGKSILTDEDIDFIARNTAMKREAVEIQYKTFLQKHPDGRISRKSFHMMMKECYPGQVLLIFAWNNGAIR